MIAEACRKKALKRDSSASSNNQHTVEVGVEDHVKCVFDIEVCYYALPAATTDALLTHCQQKTMMNLSTPKVINENQLNFQLSDTRANHNDDGKYDNLRERIKYEARRIWL